MTYSSASLIASLALRFPGARPWLENRPQIDAGAPSAAPEAPSVSPLEPQLTHISRLEEIFSRQEAQYRRAEENCAILRAQKEPANVAMLMKADAFANRLLQQQTRLLRELRQARKELEALTKELDEIARQVHVMRDDALRDVVLPDGVLRDEAQTAQDASWENERPKFPPPPLTFAQSVVRKHGRQIDATPPKEHALPRAA